MNDYVSFLVCDRGEVSELYVNGLSIGTMRSGKFERHELKDKRLEGIDLDRLELKVVELMEESFFTYESK